MRGSSASATGVDPSFLSAGFTAGWSGGGIETSTGFGGGGNGSARAGGGSEGGGGGSEGGGSVATGPGAGGRDPPAPGINEKSSAREDEIHGTCSLRDARVTPTRVLLSVSSAIRSGTRISFSNSCTNRLRSRPLSWMTEDSAAESITSVPFGPITAARPAAILRN